MLDQYKKDPSQEDPNNFEENKLHKKKIALALSGATFALVFFLFLMGLFRSEDAPKITRVKTNQTIDLSTLEERVSELHKRLDRIELTHAQLGQTQFVAQSDEQKNINFSRTDNDSVPLNEGLQRNVNQNDSSTKTSNLAPSPQSPN